MIPLVAQAAEVQQFFDARRWRYCVIGGVAVIRWGEPRLTQDVDFSLFTGFGSEATYVGALLATFESRIADPLGFAVANRIVLLRGTSGVPFDIALAGFPFEEAIIDRSTEFEFIPGVKLRTAAAEDLIVLKAFANRRQDWTDVAGIVTRQPTLDWGAINARLAPLVELKGEPEILVALERVRKELEPD